MPEAVTVEIPYTIDNGEVLVNESFGPKNILGRRSGTVELKTMTLLNGRALGERLSLDEQGFVFVEHKTKVADFFDENQLKSVYYPEIEQLIKRESGASRVVIFDHALRSGDLDEREEKLIRTRFCRRTTTTPNGPVQTGCARFCRRKQTNYSSAASRSFKYGARSIG